MPPARTFPPTKATKTERTHEENQERAYIAASRRSDRSLEARVESARRASEIHKRRTGRSLRVTEQDVINEEMYEEEDDGLPMQYRRLTAHLQTGSADFNRRLAAYLTNQVAMRNAVERMANNSCAQQYGVQSGMAYQQPRQNMFQSGMIHHQQHAMLQSATTPGSSYRQAPYPSPHHPGFHHNQGRAYSAAVVSTGNVQTPPSPASSSLEHRRMSTPATLPHQIETLGLNSDSNYVRQTQSAQALFNPFWQDHSLFTTSLPPESQQMLAGTQALDPDDPFTANLMSGSEQYLSNPYYPWGHEMQYSTKHTPVQSSVYPNMSVTLAPAALTSESDPHAATVDAMMSTCGIDPLGLSNVGVFTKETHSPHSMASGQNTPGESFWSNFVQDGSWSEENTSSG